MRDFGRLVQARLREAERNLDGQLPVSWDVGPYAHFRKPRGYGVTFCHRGNTGPCAHMRFAPKILHAPLHRQDGVLLHEIGHAVDHICPARALDRWARQNGVRLPKTPEQRADAIALAIFGVPVRYDQELVQSTRYGAPKRPAQLGA
jgi:hypothetical protein